MEKKGKVRKKPETRKDKAIGDSIALKLQALRGADKIDDAQPLIRLDYRKEAEKAPFQFDIANGKLHRSQCSAIPKDSSTALYGIWIPGAGDMALACNRCKPVLPESQGGVAMGKGEGKDFAKDIVFGFLSIIDQFGSVLTERGREYRSSDRGKQAEKAFDALYGELDKKQKEVLDVTLSSLDTLIDVVRSFDTGFGGNQNESKAKGNGNASKSRKNNGKTNR